MSPSHGRAFYIDSAAGQNMDASYIGYQVNSATARTGLWTKLDGFTGGAISLANPLDATQGFADFAGADTQTAFFLLKASAASTVAQKHVFHIYDRNPAVTGAIELYSCSFSFIKVQEAIKASTNSLTSVTPPTITGATIGTTFTETVMGTTGKIGTGSSPDFDAMWLNPAPRSSFPSRALRLVGTSASVYSKNSNGTCSGTASGTFTNQLLIPGMSALTGGGPTGCYSVIYTFRVIGPAPATILTPNAMIASGTQMKHTPLDSLAAATTTAVDLSASKPVGISLSKSVDTSTGTTFDTTTVNGSTYLRIPYKIVVSDTGTSAVSVDQIVDMPDASALISPFDSVTVTTGGATPTTKTYAAPTAKASDGSVVYSGPFTVNATNSTTVKYYMLVPFCAVGGTAAAYANTAKAFIGDTVIGSATAGYIPVTTVQQTTCGSGSVSISNSLQQLAVLATTSPATGIDTMTATLNGNVNFNMNDTATIYFDYSLSPTLASGVTSITATPQPVVTSSLTTLESRTITGLTQGTTYYFRIRVGNVVQGGILSFTTTQVPSTPTAVTSPATAVDTQTATLNGGIDPNLTATYVYLKIESTTALSFTSPVLYQLPDDPTLAYNGTNNPYTLLSSAGTVSFAIDFRSLITGGLGAVSGTKPAVTTGATYLYEFFTDTVSGAAAPRYAGAPPQQFTLVTHADQTITFGSIADRQYGQTATFAPTSSSGLPLTLVVSGSCTIETATGVAATSMTVPSGTSITLRSSGVGTCTVFADQPGGSSGGTLYNPALQVVQSTNFTPVPITVTALPQSRAYGVANPTLTYSVTGSLVGSDAISSATLSTTATTSSPVGTYPISVSAATFSTGVAANYSITYVSGTLTVTAAPLTIRANPASMVYGQAVPTFTFSASGLIGTDTVTSVTETSTAGSSPAVGAYPIYVSAAVFGSGSAANYNISYISDTLTVSPVVTKTVTFVAGTGSGTLVAPSSVTVNSGSSITLPSSAGFSKTGYHFTGWLNGATYQPGDTVTITTDTTFTAQWAIDTFTVTASAGTGGSISPAGVTTKDYGSSETFTVTANTGWHLASLTVDGSPASLTGGLYVFTNITANHTIAATFAIDTHVLTTGVVGSGTITPNTGTHTYNYGDTVTVTTSPSTGWHFTGFTGACTGTGACTVTMNADETVTTTFVIDTHTVTYNSNGGTPVSGATVNYGDTITVAAAPTRTGYHFTGWNFSSTTAQPGDTLTVTSDLTLVAGWAIDTYLLTTNVVGSGSITRAPTGTSHDYNTSVLLTAVPTLGWHFVSWTGCSSLTDTCTVTMTADETVTATFVIDTHVLTTNVVGSGSITRAPTGTTYDYNTSVLLTATPALGWHFVSWTGCSSLTDTCTLTMNADETVTATFVIDTHTVTYNSNGGTPVSGATVSYGDTITVAAAPTRTGYHFTGWSFSSSTEQPGDTLTVTSDLTLVAGWAIDTHVLTTNVVGSGTITPNSGSHGYNYGDTVTVSASPATGWHFTGFTGACTGTGSCTVTMHADETVTATFVIDTHTVTYNSNGGSAVTGGTVNYGDTITVAAAPTRTGYHFTGWSFASTTAQPGDTMTVTSDLTLIAGWVIDTHLLTTAVVGSGTISPNTGTHSYNYGDTVTVTASPSTGWHFTGFTGACTGSGPCTVTMNADETVTASFAIDTHVLTTNVVGSGTISPNIGTHSYNYGDTVTVTASPSTGWHFTGWTGACTGTGACTVTMNADETVTATFVIDTHTVTYNSNGGSAVSGATVNYGDTITVAAAPTRTGYHFTGWSFASTTAQPGDTLTVTSDLTLVAGWAIDTHVLTTNVVGSGTITPLTGTHGYNYGDTVTVTASPATGWHFIGFSGACTGTGACAVTMNADETVTATFAIDTHVLTTGVVGSGTISPNTGTHSYNYGDTVTVTASPSTGWHFTGFSGACTGIGACIVTMNTDETVTANFAIDTHVLATGVVGSGTILPALGTHGYNYGDTVTVTASPSTGWHFTGFTGACVGMDTCTVTMNADETVTATFVIDTHVLTTNVSGSGSITRAPAAGSYDFNTAVILTATPNIGWHFVSWTGCSSLTDTCTVNVTADETVTANFAIDTHVLTTGVVGSGTVLPTLGTHTYNYGDTITVSASPAAGWHFTGFTGACVGMDTCTVTMNADETVTATFVINPPNAPTVWLLTTGTSGSGSVTPAGTTTQYAGSQITLTPTAAPGWHFVSWQGDCTGADVPLRFTMTSNRSCTAVFERDPAKTEVSNTPASPVQIAPTETTATAPGTGALPPLEPGSSLVVHPTLLPQAKGIASATLVNGALTYVAQSGFSGKTDIPLLYTAPNGLQVIILVPVTVLPEAPKVGSFTPKDPKHTTLVWESSPNAIGYEVRINGVLACSVASVSLCAVNRILGPANRIEVTAIGNDGTTSAKTINAYAPDRFISLVTVHFAPNKAVLSSAALTKLKLFVKLMRQEGFTSVKIRAYTDAQGGTRNATSLSSKRAKVVAKYLSQYLKVTILTVPRGLKDPVASNLTMIGQALNRRATAAVR